MSEKKLWYFILIFLFSSSLFAQKSSPISAGSVLFGFNGTLQRAGGDLKNDHQVNIEKRWENYNEYSMILNINGFIFPFNHIAFGATSSIYNTSRGGERLFEFQYGVRCAYFMGGQKSKFYPFGTFGVDYKNISNNGDYSEELSYASSAGLIYMINKYAGLTSEILASETPNKFFNKKQIKETLIAFNFGLAFFIF